MGKYQIEFIPNPVNVPEENKTAVKNLLKKLRAKIGSDIRVIEIEEPIMIEPEQ